MSLEGHIIAEILSGGNRADISIADELTANIHNCYIVEDKGYDSDRHRENIRNNNNIPVIPGRKNRIKTITYNKNIYRKRIKIEQLFGKIKENRRLALRFEKNDITFLSFIALAIIKIII